ncbi:MAG: DUF308 domain-containing protein [Clostridia bacterium]|nr:DUF308 domain-containing protein [Clostridia bacterium]
MRTVKLIRAAKAGYISLSAVLCGLGAILVVNPGLSVSLMGRLLAAVLIAYGCIKLVGYFSRDLYRLAFQFDLAFGTLLIVLGALILCMPSAAINALCVIMGVETIADGLFKVQTALDARRFGLERWWLILALAVATAGFGVALALRPTQATEALVALLGMTLLAEGQLNLCVGVCAVKIIDRQCVDGELL